MEQRTDQEVIQDIVVGVAVITPMLLKAMAAIDAGEDHLVMYCAGCDRTHEWSYKEILDRVDVTALVISGLARRDEQACELVVEQFLHEHR